MTPEDLQKRAIKMFGRRWKREIATALGVHLATIYRWLPQRDKPPECPVPKYVATWFELQDSRNKIARFAKSLTR